MIPGVYKICSGYFFAELKGILEFELLSLDLGRILKARINTIAKVPKIPRVYQICIESYWLN